MAKYKIGDILNVHPSETDEEKHNRSSLFTKFVIIGLDTTLLDYIGYYTIPYMGEKKFSMILDIKQIDNDPDYQLSIKEKLKKL